MNDILLTISQALQLVAIAPCLFVIVFLLCTGRRALENLVAALYFTSLMCSFILPLTAIFPSIENSFYLRAALLTGQNLTVPLSFLLVMQFLYGTTPRLTYWLILSLPLVGGSPFVYTALAANEVCLDVVNCYSTASLNTLYGIFSTAVILLLLTYKLSTSASSIAINELDRSHRYWIIISLVMLNLVLAVLDLLVLADKLPKQDVLVAGTVIRIAFIYLVLTSIFAVFYELFELKPEAAESSMPRTQEQDRALVDKLSALLEYERIYREMGLTRAKLADRLSIGEHQASRIINAYFHKNFNELINSHRVEEAKLRLASEDTAITTIAFEVGFNSIASFNRVFKELVGSAPSEYRTTHRNEAATPAHRSTQAQTTP